MLLTRRLATCARSYRIEMAHHDMQKALGELSIAHSSFRVVSTASKSMPLKDWLSDEHANMFFPIAARPMGREEEASILLDTGCAPETVKRLLDFAEKHRATMASDSAQKNRKLGTRALIRIARRLAKYPSDNDLHFFLSRSILAEFLPATETLKLQTLFAEVGIRKRTPAVSGTHITQIEKLNATQYNPPPSVEHNNLVFPEPSDPYKIDGEPTLIPLFDKSQDPEGVASHIPHMDHFYDNHLQTGLMRDIAIDLEVLGEHLVLLGNQVSGSTFSYRHAPLNILRRA